jgi:nucleoside-diphosphate-sugar epimerase
MNNYPIATILGGGGFIGRYLVRNLTKKNFRCIIPTRNAFTKGYLKTQAAPGTIELLILTQMKLKMRSKIQISL